ncbi:MAG: hypothetical protein AB7T14_04045 [Candidatus Methylacidiphilaceae bacterium]
MQKDPLTIDDVRFDNGAQEIAYWNGRGHYESYVFRCPYAPEEEDLRYWWKRGFEDAREKEFAREAEVS